MDYASDLKGQVYQNPGDAFHLQKWLLLKPCMILRKGNVSRQTLHARRIVSGSVSAFHYYFIKARCTYGPSLGQMNWYSSAFCA